MDEMYLVNIYAKKRSTRAESGDTVEFLDQHCDVTDSQGRVLYNGRAQISNLGANGKFHEQGLNTLADVLLLKSASFHPLFCLTSTVRDVDANRLIQYSSSELGILVSKLNYFIPNRWYCLEKNDAPKVKDTEPILRPVELTSTGEFSSQI